jgi:NAD(P)-dependent dehydrogenase (short-subunit alcohol dehydrogenase family)
MCERPAIVPRCANGGRPDPVSAQVASVAGPGPGIEAGIAPEQATRGLDFNEVTRVAAFLARPGSSAITGIDLPVDCGMLSSRFAFDTLPS